MNLKELQTSLQKPANDVVAKRSVKKMENHDVKESKMQQVVSMYNLALKKLDKPEQNILTDYNTKWAFIPGKGEPWQKGFFEYLKKNESKFTLGSIEDFFRDVLQPVLLAKANDSASPREKKLAEVTTTLWEKMEKVKREYKPGVLSKEIATDEKNMSPEDGAKTLDPLGGVFSLERITFCLYNIRRQILGVVGIEDIGFWNKYGDMINQSTGNDNAGTAVVENVPGYQEKVLQKATDAAAGERMAELDPNDVVAPNLGTAVADTQEQVAAATVVDLNEAGNQVAANDTIPLAPVNLPSQGEAQSAANDSLEGTGT